VGGHAGCISWLFRWLTRIDGPARWSFRHGEKEAFLIVFPQGWSAAWQKYRVLTWDDMARSELQPNTDAESCDWQAGLTQRMRRRDGWR